MKLLIKNGRVVDPANQLDEICDILVIDGKISKVAKNISCQGCRTIEATGKIVMPGLVDMHVHLREPGREDQETIASGTQAALKGGVTSLLAMPNTTPAIDCARHTGLLKKLIKKDASVNVLIAGAITQGRAGRKLADISQLAKAGVVAITDDGASVDDPRILLSALKQAGKERLLLICHCEDIGLSAKGTVNLGIASTRMGLRGISKESEYLRIKRDLDLAKKADAPIHIAHVSCKESVEIIAQAKKRGVKVSAEATPHHFALTEESVYGFDTNMKMNPPLRARQDAQAVKKGLKDGTIDAIASDHAPHTENEKDIEFERANFGAIGLETELAVSISELINTEILDWPQLARRLSLSPARILGVNKGTLGAGCDADIIVISPKRQWVVEKDKLISKSKNSPFIGRTLSGIVEYTILEGKVAYQSK